MVLMARGLGKGLPDWATRNSWNRFYETVFAGIYGPKT
jgi:hypothetical protein